MKSISKKIILFIFISAFMAINFGNVFLPVWADEDVENAQKALKKTQAELDKEQQELQKSQANLSVTQSQINSTSYQLSKTEEEISRKETELENLAKRIELNKQAMTAYAQEMYMNDLGISWTLSLSNVKFNEYFENFDQMLNLKEKFLAVVQEIKKDKNKLEEVKGELAEKKEEHQEILVAKQGEKNEIVADINETKATIGELQKKLAKLQSDLTALTGKSFNAKDISEAITFASKKTGVPKGVLFAFLTQESGRGRNTGQCTYDDMEKKATDAYKKYKKIHGSPYKSWNYNTSISRLTTRKDLFEDLIKKLGYSKKKKVSCAIIPADFSRYEPNQGGAMGVAQFMSDSWLNSGLQSQIKSFTGHSVPDPWSLTDGTMALAIKVRDAGGTSTSSSAVKKMVTNYYGASPDSSSVAKNYYNNVMYYIKNYDKLID